MGSHKEFICVICNICHLSSINGCRRPEAHYSYKSLPTENVQHKNPQNHPKRSTGNDMMMTWSQSYCGFSGPLNVDTPKSPQGQRMNLHEVLVGFLQPQTFRCLGTMEPILKKNTPWKLGKWSKRSVKSFWDFMIRLCFFVCGGWYYTCLIATDEEKETSLLIVRMCSSLDISARKCNYVNDAVEVKGQFTIRRSDFWIRSGNYSYNRRYKFVSHVLREVWGSVILRGLPNTCPSCERGGHYLSRQLQTFHAYVMAGGNNNSSLPLSSRNRGYFAYDHRMAWTSSVLEYAWKWPVSSYPFDSAPNKALEVTEQPYGLLIKYHCLF